MPCSTFLHKEEQEVKAKKGKNRNGIEIEQKNTRILDNEKKYCETILYILYMYT